ncbi:MAG: DUF951 domain-containing protein [Anaerolineales bacterium]|nr:DUF951 domain-containing protein [Anaerolineales bacterium]
MAKPVVGFRLGDVLRLRKPHPCGGYEWRVVRLGADLGLECLTCHRRVLLERREVEKRLKAFVSRGPEAGAGELESAE